MSALATLRRAAGFSLGPLLLLTSIFFFNFCARLVMAPLMPRVEQSLGLSHAQAGSLFLLLSLGYCLTLLGSGFVSARLTHRGSIILSALATGVAMLLVSLSGGLAGLGGGLVLVGLGTGLYLPSDLATLTSLVPAERWGRALAVHEMAPNLGFVVAPLFGHGALVGVYLEGAWLAWGWWPWPVA